MLKRIAVHIDRDPACEGRLAAALTLGKACQGRVIGIYAQDPPFNYGFDEAVLPRGMLELQRKQMSEQRQRCAQIFCQQAAAAGVEKSWIAEEGLREDILARHARCNDVLVLSQADPQGHSSSIEPQQLESVILTAGRPVLAIPYAADPVRPMERILICWDHGRESARAIADAAPLLAKATEIVVLMVDEGPQPLAHIHKSMGGLDAYLRAHDYVEAVPVTGSSKGIGIGNVILNTASDHGSDLIVMGLFGHSRAREWVLGGASRDMLTNMTVPVLFSH